jgi:SAM-dependent methyltransferase
MTQHLGGIEATRELARLCRVASGGRLLDVGCGVGATPCTLAKTTGCWAVGIDLIPSMILQSRKRARAEGVHGAVSFQVADARQLPFSDGAFDAVLMESVNIFFDDKRLPIGEAVRVTRSGGYVGLTEITWLKPPSPEEKAFYKRVFHAETLGVDGWTSLLEGAGLTGVTGSASPVNVPLEAKSEFERYGCLGTAQVLAKLAVAFLWDRQARASLMVGARGLIGGMLRNLGCGLFAGRKALSHG